MSQALKNSLTTVTPFKPIGFFITGEQDRTTQVPGLVVLKNGCYLGKIIHIR
jgi:hypothetical protein